jgi:hypothetical protein
MVCVDLVGPFTIKTPLKTHSLLAITMIDPATGWFENVKATNKSAASVKDLFLIIPGWHVIHVLNLLSLTMGKNSNVSLSKCAIIIALLTDQLLVTTLKQMQSLSKYTK